MSSEADDETIDTCPGCGDRGYRDEMINEMHPDREPSVKTAVCENRDCRVGEFYIILENRREVSNAAE